MAWGAARPQSLGVRVMTDREDCPELHEHDGTSPLWFPKARTVVAAKASGAGQVLDTIEEALARVADLKRLALDAAWLVRAHAKRAGHRALRQHGP